jgi:hypothetical protein
MNSNTKLFNATVHMNTVDGVSILEMKSTGHSESTESIRFWLPDGYVVIPRERLIYFKMKEIAPESEADHD